MDNSPKSPFGSVVETLKSHWSSFTQGAAWILAVAGTFLFPPPVDVSGGDQMWPAFNRLVVAAVVGLLAVPLTIWKRKQDTWKWWWVALISLLGFILAFVLYVNLSAENTVAHGSRRVVIGDDKARTDTYRTHVLTNPELGDNDEEIVADFGGQTGSLWTKQSLIRNRNHLSITYVLTACLLAISLMAVTQAYECSRRD